MLSSRFDSVISSNQVLSEHTVEGAGSQRASVLSENTLSVQQTSRSMCKANDAGVDRQCITNACEVNAENNGVRVLMSALVSVGNVVSTGFVRQEINKVIVRDDIHVPQGSMPHDRKMCDEGQRIRLNDEYHPLHHTVFLQGTPERLGIHHQLSLPVSPSMLTEKLIEVIREKNEKEQRASQAEKNGYVCQVGVS